VFVALAFVEFVRTVADDVGANRHSRAAPFTRPIFSGFEQARTGAEAALAFADDEAPAGTMGKRIPPERLATFHADAPATQIHDQVAPQAGDIIVRKVRVGPFGTTDLHDQLQAKGIDTLILAGISTSGVVLSAVRDGHDRDYRLIVLSDLSADRELDVHEFLINRVISKQADVISTADLPGLLNN